MIFKRKTSYCASWEKEFPYLRKVKNGIYCGFCIACNKTFLINGSDKSQVRLNMTNPSHLECEKSCKKQIIFTTCTGEVIIVMDKPNNVMMNCLMGIGSTWCFQTPK